MTKEARTKESKLSGKTLEDYLKNGIKITQESLDKFKKDAAAWRNEV